MTDAGPRPRWWRWLAIAGGVGAAIGLTVWIVFGLILDDTTTPIDTDEVVEDFREEVAETQPTPTPMPTAEVVVAVPLPEPGVYVYTTTGFEEVDALGGARHEYPAETTITVARTACGVELRWDAIVERHEILQLCEIDGALFLPEYVSYHEFFGQPDTQGLECDTPVLILPADLAATEAAGTCRNDRLTEDHAIAVSDPGPVAIGGEELEAVVVAVTVTVGPEDGESQGLSTASWWFHAETGVLLRWVETVQTVNSSPVGDVSYSEEFELVIRDLEPRT